MKITETTIKALGIIQDEGPIRPRRFAELMWPDNPNWTKCSNIGYGATSGVGMWRAGGGYLGKLRVEGLVYMGFPHSAYDPYSYSISAEGRKVLKEHSNKQEE